MKIKNYKGVPIKMDMTEAMNRRVRKLFNSQPRYLGPKYRQQAARDATLKLERLARKAFAKKAAPVRRIKARTPQRAKDEATCRKEVKVWLALPENFWCKACQPLNKVMNPMSVIQTQPASQCHHQFGRRGRLLLHKPFWVPVCCRCHSIITFVSPSAAREAGVLCPEGRYNDQSIVP